MLERRLARLERNALAIAERLRPRAPVGVQVVHPGLRQHPCAEVAASLGFRGGCVSIVFDEGDERPGRERRLVESAVQTACERGVALAAGSSFGFDTTRIYPLTDPAHGTSFVRIAAGAEHRLALEAVAEVLADALEALTP
jgi:cystathionine beta-lyase/cystathionine gamma-synthase